MLKVSGWTMSQTVCDKPFDFFSFPGVYRIACEVTMQLLRDNRDSLMSVLDAFIYDPLVEWEDEKRKLVSGYFFFKFGVPLFFLSNNLYYV